MSHNLYGGEDHTAKYRLHRPSYPNKLFEYITDYYFNGKNKNEKISFVLDVGCGSGQATIDLSPFCERVIGIDVSADQIGHAIPKDNIEYRCNTGEDLSFLQSNSIDLITIATTLHWLDIEVFLEEAKRVLKSDGGVLAIWIYTFGTLDNPIADAIYHDFHHVVLCPYWNPKQHLVDDYYHSLLPLFPYKSTLREYTIECQIETTLEDFLGLIETGSACQIYRKQNGDQAYQHTLNTLRHKLIQSYCKTEVENDNDQTKHFDSTKIIISRPIRLYLMKKKLDFILINRNSYVLNAKNVSEVLKRS